MKKDITFKKAKNTGRSLSVKVTSVNIYAWQREVMDKEELDFSKLVRHLLAQYLESNFPTSSREAKKVQLELERINNELKREV